MNEKQQEQLEEILFEHGMDTSLSEMNDTQKKVSDFINSLLKEREKGLQFTQNELEYIRDVAYDERYVNKEGITYEIACSIVKKITDFNLTLQENKE